MLERWSQWIARQRRNVIVLWIALTFAGIFAGSHLNQYLTTSIAVPGSESAKADHILATAFQENIEGTFTVVLNFKNASDEEIASFKSKIARASQVIPTSKVTQQRAIGGLLFANIGSRMGLYEAATYTDDFRAALLAEGLKQALVTGPPAIDADVSPVLSSDLQRGQIIALLMALLLLILMLGTCRAVLIPFLFALATISTSLGVIFLLAQKMVMVLYIPNIVELIGLGLAIDYSLLVVHRFRKESQGRQEGDALATTMRTAGKTVIVSGICVAIALATLLLVPIPFVRSLGAAGIVVPLVSVIAALTLQPALLSYFGKGGVTPRGFVGAMARRDPMEGFIARMARMSVRRPLRVLTVSLVLLFAISGSILSLHVTPSSITALPQNLESSRALDTFTHKAGAGIITPHEIVIDLGSPALASTFPVESARMNLVEVLSRDKEVFVTASGVKEPFVDPTGRYLRVFLVSHHDIGAPQTVDLVKRLRTGYLHATHFPPATRFYVSGGPAQGFDLISALKSSAPKIVTLMLAITYFLLLRALRSLLLPLKAIAMDLLSITSACGILVLLFKSGIGSTLLGTYHLPQIEAWVLLFLFALLFGLSMDYELFIVSRMREVKDRGVSNSEAIVEGMAETGGVVSGAALILVAAATGLILGDFAGLQEVGVGLAFGLLIDATIIRGLLLPATMVLLGRWNWWLPASLARVLKVKASPLGSRETRL